MEPIIKNTKKIELQMHVYAMGKVILFLSEEPHEKQKKNILMKNTFQQSFEFIVCHLIGARAAGSTFVETRWLYFN